QAGARWLRATDYAEGGRRARGERGLQVRYSGGRRNRGHGGWFAQWRFARLCRVSVWRASGEGAVIGDQSIKLSLRREFGADGKGSAKRGQDFGRWVGQTAKVGGVDLGVAVEVTEVGVEHAPVKVGEQTAGEHGIEALAGGVEIVEVVFKADPSGAFGQARGVNQTGYDAFALLLGGEATHDDVGGDRHQQIGAFDRHGFAGAGRHLRRRASLLQQIGAFDRHGKRVGFFAAEFGPDQ